MSAILPAAVSEGLMPAIAPDANADRYDNDKADRIGVRQRPEPETADRADGLTEQCRRSQPVRPPFRVYGAEGDAEVDQADRMPLCDTAPATAINPAASTTPSAGPTAQAAGWAAARLERHATSRSNPQGGLWSAARSRHRPFFGVCG